MTMILRLGLAALLMVAGAGAGLAQSSAEQPQADQTPPQADQTPPAADGAAAPEAEDVDLLGQLEPADLEARLATALDELRSEDEATWRRAERRARKIFARAASPSFDLLLSRARAALEAKNYPAAREHLEALTTLGPAVAEGWRLFGLLELAEGHTGAAVSHLMLAAGHEPRNFDTLYQLGLLFQKFEAPAQAFTALEQALALHPNFEEAAAAREALRPDVEGRGA